jgi:Transposase DDE domain group 1/Domain of unknown function (DUF4387)
VAYPISPNLIDFRRADNSYGTVVFAGTRDPVFQRHYDAIKAAVVKSVEDEFPEALRHATYTITVASADHPVVVVRTVAKDPVELARKHQEEVEAVTKLVTPTPASLQSLHAADCYEWSLYHLLVNERVIKEQLFPIQLYQATGDQWAFEREVRPRYRDIGVADYKGDTEERTLSLIENRPPVGEPLAYRPLADMAMVIRSKNAGVNRLTFDIIFNSQQDYEVALHSNVFCKAHVAELLQIPMDSTGIAVCGRQEQSADNGHCESTCDHPLLLCNREGDGLAAKLRPGNAHRAEDWEELLLPEIERQQKQGKEVVFRADAACAMPEIYEALEERSVKYAIRLPANDSPERGIGELLTRPVGRPSSKPVVWYKSVLSQAASWKTARRVVAKVASHLGELFPRVGFIVTHLETDSQAVVRFYNKRGTAEQWIKAGKQAVKMTRPSCHRFRSHEVRLWLSVIAYNLGNLWRRLVLPKRIEKWLLTRVQQRLVKTGAG